MEAISSRGRWYRPEGRHGRVQRKLVGSLAVADAAVQFYSLTIKAYKDLTRN
jgi:hypothetical protein